MIIDNLCGMTKEEERNAFRSGFEIDPKWKCRGCSEGHGGSPGIIPRKPTPRRSDKEVAELIRNLTKNTTDMYYVSIISIV
jgi:hypothetical protein